jgi:Uncharacterized conserved protein, contains double-stranded beta-helix domain
MIVLDALDASRKAIAPSPSRPATAILFDSADMRLVVFRILPGQAVTPHQNSSTVTLTVLEGTGSISGREGERACRVGEMVTFDPGETHGMRATDQPFHLLATITPRPGGRPSPAALAHAGAR